MKNKKKKKEPKGSVDCYGIKVTDKVGKITFSERRDGGIMHELGDLGKW